MLLYQFGEALTCARDFKNSKLFTLMQICIQNSNSKAKVVIIACLLKDYKKKCIKIKFCIHISIKLNNLGFLKSAAHVNASVD